LTRWICRRPRRCWKRWEHKVILQKLLHYRHPLFPS
jgi:hypothetical protein